MLSYPVPVAKATRSPIITDRQKVVSFRATPEELALIEKKAAQLGLKLSQYVRMLALKDAQENLKD